jgi:hypothetical protein
MDSVWTTWSAGYLHSCSEVRVDDITNRFAANPGAILRTRSNIATLLQYCTTKEHVLSILCMPGARLDPTGVPGYLQDLPCGDLHARCEVHTVTRISYTRCDFVSWMTKSTHDEYCRSVSDRIKVATLRRIHLESVPLHHGGCE